MKHYYCTSSFWQGVRIIFALLVCMLFTFVFVVSPVKVKAEAFPIPPVWLPMNPYNAQGLEGNYVLLNDDQKEIVKEIIGAVNVVNLGFGQYVLMNPISGIHNTRQFLRDYGGTFLETFWTQIMGTSRAMTDFVGSTIYKASTYDTLEEYEADTEPSVATGSQKYFQISPELTVAFKNWYRANGGVEDWQSNLITLNPALFQFNWQTSSISSSATQEYYNYLNSLPLPHVKFNLHPLGDFKNCYLGGSAFLNACNIFVNLTQHVVYVCDNNGQQVNEINVSALFYDSSYNSSLYYSSRIVNFHTLSYNDYTSLKDLYDSIDADSSIIADSGNPTKLDLSSFITGLYVGNSWAERQPWTAIEDLNIGSSPSEYIDNISDTGYVDINTLIGQIADEVVNLREVVEESVFVKDNDSAIPYADSLQVAIDKYINQPESGVVIPSNIFGGLTGANGPVSYLWYMTKPLVSYTGDLLGVLTLDGDGTFQFTGLGYIVIGVVTIGIIGGLVTKCLL